MVTILIVDDNDQNRYILQVLLKGHGYQVTEAANGIEALNTAKAEPPDLIISDILMPEMDGFELCRAWKKEAQLSSVPFIFYTATYTEPKDESLAFRLGADRFVIKPKEPDEILALVSDVMATRGNQTSDLEIDEKEFQTEHGLTVARKLDKKIGELTLEIRERERLEKERELLMSAIEQSAEAVMITDVHGTIQYVNPIFEKQTGYERREIVGRNPRFLKSGKQGPEFYQRMWSTILKGESWEGRVVNKKKDGHLYTEDMAISPVRDAAGRIGHFVAVKRDVTRLLNMERQIRHSGKMEVVGQLAGGVAHDFNNLLQVILGYTTLILAETEPSNALRGNLEQVHSAAIRASNLTRQLLAFSRRKSLDRVNLDINNLIRSLGALLKRLIGEDIEFKTELAEELEPVYADPGQIEQVLMNLCVNARDAMPNGGSLTLRTDGIELDDVTCKDLAGARPGRFVRVTVQDSGSGMSEDLARNIFEPFFTTKEDGSGTGLGLSSSHQIIDEHQGFIRVESQIEVGSSFFVYLPVSDKAAQSVHELPEPHYEGGSETILVAEDETAACDLAATILEKAGYRVLTAHDGQEALSLFERHRNEIDLALLDIVMPRLGGRIVQERIQASRVDMCFLFTSGYSLDAPRIRADLEQGLPLIRKPYKANELLLRIRETLDKRTLKES